MSERLIEPPAKWASACHALVLALALTLLLAPSTRISAVYVPMMVAYLIAFVESLYRLKRAGALSMTMRTFAGHAPAARTPVESLEAAAVVLGAIAMVFATLIR